MNRSPDTLNQYLPPRNFLEKFIEWAFQHSPRLASFGLNRSWKFKTASVKVLVGGEGGVTVISIGNSHIDAAWLWRKQDTLHKKLPVTFARALHHMNKYPLFTYSQNQVVYYAWMKEHYPVLFSLIKQRVVEGRWDYTGGDWVECDANIPSGESHVRQRLYGQRFYLAEFGAISDMAWADDVFGFPWSLPQILVKSGARYWWTNKFCYNDVNFFPLTTWRWRGIDGTEILAHWAQHKNGFNKMLARMSEAARLSPLGKEIVLDTKTDWAKVQEDFSQEIAPVLGNFYGHGDGGNGPKPLEILEQLAWARAGHVTLGTTKKLWSLLESYRNRVPVWADELYLERHRGTLTSIHMIKENNRTAEILLQVAESLGVFATLAGASPIQPQISRWWETVLFNQFHDVLPGSSIIEVYQDAGEEYKALYAGVIPLVRQALTNLTATNPSTVEKTDKTVATYAIVNTSYRDRTGYFVIPAPNKNPFRVLHEDGTELHWQTIAWSPFVSNRDIGLGPVNPTGYRYMANISGAEELHALDVDQTPNILLLVKLPPEKCVPAFGMTGIIVHEGNPTASENLVRVQETPSEILLSNECVEIHITKSTGRVAALGQPGIATSNLLREPGAGIQMYKDPDTKFPAWDIDPTCFSNPIPTPAVREVRISETGPLRASCLVKHAKTERGTEIWVQYALHAGNPKLYCEVLVDWQEEEVFLKFDVPTALDPAGVQCEIPYGWQVRPTRPQTSMEKARWEFASQMWADFEDPLFAGPYKGLLLLNQGKYGLSTGPRYVGLSLLKSARFEKTDRQATLTYPEPRPAYIDRGFHRIPLALLPHPEWPDVELKFRVAWEYNAPLAALPVPLPINTHSFIKFSSKSVALTTLKVAEPPLPGTGQLFYTPVTGEIPVILRLVERSGQMDRAKITIPSPNSIIRCEEVDLLERRGVPGDCGENYIQDGNSVEVILRPFEIKTLLLIIRKEG